MNKPDEGKDAEQVMILGAATGGIVALGKALKRSISSHKSPKDCFRHDFDGDQ